MRYFAGFSVMLLYFIFQIITASPVPIKEDMFKLSKRSVLNRRDVARESESPTLHKRGQQILTDYGGANLEKREPYKCVATIYTDCVHHRDVAEEPESLTLIKRDHYRWGFSSRG
ncbi:uncharacterized protein FA14DRAFT_180760 [Meira miltonrushii]|uniref:Uncharacterized protein n=1 Tax=Meira miltonrushii TaxID=1280837 RepID=A0A316V9J9_9BASI|nr:uncharacterized protein FA14DRAFT_180760 [Meira miltonrushii]PWN34132.1 hypothetical protein FA14DRAFT_180760 [Meira miltonrushii]